jgi:hypothetical protein
VEGDGPRSSAGLSGNGRFVAISSFASNLDPRTGAGHGNVFVRDRRTGELTLETLGRGGQPADGPPARSGAAITPDGRYVAFDAVSTNSSAATANGQPDVFRRDAGPAGRCW